jgi:hypothetical protein
VFNRRFFAKEGGHTADLFRKGRTDMLRGVLGEIANAGYNASKDNFFLELAGET